jgi:hypothetical protein
MTRLGPLLTIYVAQKTHSIGRHKQPTYGVARTTENAALTIKRVQKFNVDIVLRIGADLVLKSESKAITSQFCACPPLWPLVFV